MNFADPLSEVFGFTTNQTPDPEKKPDPFNWLLVAAVVVVVYLFLNHYRG